MDKIRNKIKIIVADKEKVRPRELIPLGWR